jgi:hypothetical protein
MNPNSMSVFDAIADGVLLCKYINKIKPGSIEERSICRSPKNTFEVSQNHMVRHHWFSLRITHSLVAHSRSRSAACA